MIQQGWYAYIHLMFSRYSVQMSIMLMLHHKHPQELSDSQHQIRISYLQVYRSATVSQFGLGEAGLDPSFSRDWAYCTSLYSRTSGLSPLMENRSSRVLAGTCHGSKDLVLQLTHSYFHPVPLAQANHTAKSKVNGTVCSLHREAGRGRAGEN